MKIHTVQLNPPIRADTIQHDPELSGPECDVLYTHLTVEESHMDGLMHVYAGDSDTRPDRNIAIIPLGVIFIACERPALTIGDFKPHSPLRDEPVTRTVCGQFAYPAGDETREFNMLTLYWPGLSPDMPEVEEIITFGSGLILVACERQL